MILSAFVGHHRCYMTDLTKDNKDEEECRHSCCDVEHNADVVSQLIHVVHIRHQDRRHEEPNGDTQLRR